LIAAPSTRLRMLSPLGRFPLRVPNTCASGCEP